MELNINFNLAEKRRKMLRIIVPGTIMLLLISVYISSINNDREFIYLFMILVSGIGYLFERRFSGKPCILINSESISIKSNVLKKGQFISWNDIKSIDCYFTSEYKIKKTDETIMAIDVSKFDYTLMCDIKNTIGHIAKEKNIQTNF